MRRLGSLVLGAMLACSSTEVAPSAGDGGADAAAPDASDAGAVAPSTCELTRAFVERCGADLNCGASGFDAWCAANDVAVNSDAYRRAQAKCLPEIPCDAKARDECTAQHYATETPTDAQRALVDAYCATCEPGSSDCTTRARTDASTDVYVAAWELRDALVDEIRTKCTGASLDAGADCAKAFGSCAAEVYLDSVPDCP